MAYAAATILVSSLTTFGLIAVWAAVSSAHWFWRTGLLLGSLLPLLVVSATEPIAAFAIQATIVTVGIRWAPWERVTGVTDPPVSSRVSVLDLLLLCTLASFVAASARHATLSLAQDTWQSVVCIGSTGGLATLIGWWIGTKKAPKARIRCVVGIAAWGSIGTIAASCDWFVFCFDNLAQWPPDRSGGTWGFYGRYDLGEPVGIWYLILGAQMIITAWTIRGFVSWVDSPMTEKRFAWRTVAPAFSAILLILVLTPSLNVGVAFMSQHSLPVVATQDPNGYLDLLQARKLLPASPLVEAVDFEPWEADEEQLDKASSELKPALDRVDVALSKPSAVVIDYDDATYHPLSETDDFYTFMRGIAAQARLSMLRGDVELAADRYLDILALANACSQGGLVTHGEAATRFDHVGQLGFYLLLDELPVHSLPTYADRLRRLESGRERAEQIVRRSETWVQRSEGWYGHLVHIYGLRHHYRLFELRSHIFSQRDSSAASRLLRSEMALRCYQSDRGEWPETMHRLVPSFLSNLLIDPCSPSGKPLKYIREGDSYQLYSVGPDGEDDHGKKSTMSLDLSISGDVSLRDLFGHASDKAKRDE